MTIDKEKFALGAKEVASALDEIAKHGAEIIKITQLLADVGLHIPGSAAINAIIQEAMPIIQAADAAAKAAKTSLNESTNPSVN